MPDLVIPREVGERIVLEMFERIRAACSQLVTELAPLAHSDYDAFDRAWCERVDRIAAEALETARAENRKWSATEEHWRKPQ